MLHHAGRIGENQPTAATDTRVPLQNCFCVRVVEKARRDALHSLRKGASAFAQSCVDGSKLDLERQIGKRARVEWTRH